MDIRMHFYQFWAADMLPGMATLTYATAHSLNKNLGRAYVTWAVAKWLITHQLRFPSLAPPLPCPPIGQTWAAGLGRCQYPLEPPARPCL